MEEYRCTCPNKGRHVKVETITQKVYMCSTHLQNKAYRHLLYMDQTVSSLDQKLWNL